MNRWADERMDWWIDRQMDALYIHVALKHLDIGSIQPMVPLSGIHFPCFKFLSDFLSSSQRHNWLAIKSRQMWFLSTKVYLQKAGCIMWWWGEGCALGMGGTVSSDYMLREHLWPRLWTLSPSEGQNVVTETHQQDCKDGEVHYTTNQF